MKNKKILGAVEIVNSVVESNSVEWHYVLRFYGILCVSSFLCSLCQSGFQHGAVLGTEIKKKAILLCFVAIILRTGD